MLPVELFNEKRNLQLQLLSSCYFTWKLRHTNMGSTHNDPIYDEPPDDDNQSYQSFEHKIGAPERIQLR